MKKLLILLVALYTTCAYGQYIPYTYDVNVTNALKVAVTNTVSMSVTNTVATTVTNALSVAVTNSPVVSGNVGVTNLSGNAFNVNLTNNPSVTISGVVTNFGTNAISGVVNTVGTNVVGGFTLVTNLYFLPPEGDGVCVSGDGLSPQLQLQNAVRTAGGTGILQSLGYINGTNVSPTFNVLVCAAPITYAGTNAAFQSIFTELATNLLRVVKSTDGTWITTGTNNVWFLSNIGQPIKCATNDLFLYCVAAGAVTNSLTGAQLLITIYQD